MLTITLSEPTDPDCEPAMSDISDNKKKKKTSSVAYTSRWEVK